MACCLHGALRAQGNCRVRNQVCELPPPPQSALSLCPRCPTASAAEARRRSAAVRPPFFPFRGPASSPKQASALPAAPRAATAPALCPTAGASRSATPPGAAFRRARSFCLTRAPSAPCRPSRTPSPRTSCSRATSCSTFRVSNLAPWGPRCSHLLPARSRGLLRRLVRRVAHHVPGHSGDGGAGPVKPLKLPARSPAATPLAPTTPSAAASRTPSTGTRRTSSRTVRGRASCVAFFTTQRHRAGYNHIQ